jgi:hypothetical protein
MVVMVFEPMTTAVQNVRAVLTPNRLVTIMIAAGHQNSIDDNDKGGDSFFGGDKFFSGD